MTKIKEDTLYTLEQKGYEYYKNGDYVNAILCYNKYIEQSPTNPVIYNMMGYLYKKLSPYDEVDKQIEYFNKALELNPNFSQAIRNLALTYPIQGEYNKAIDCFNKLFEKDAISDDYFAYACLKLRLGKFEEGWKFYEARFLKCYTRTEYPQMTKPRWEGQNIKDKILLVQYEQGFGDSLQFFRYLEQLKSIAGKIIFRVQDELAGLLKINTDIEIVRNSTPLEDLNFDFHIPLMSLPYILKATPENIPLAEGYIKADEEEVKKYKKEFFNNNCFKIGISWHGMVLGNKTRNIPLKYFYPLAKIKNVKIYSFQKESNKNEFKNLPDNIEIIDLGKTFSDFSKTAAAMTNLDLFVTSDNAILNLAGAMGKKTFLMLNLYPEWRWMLDDKTTPWYDSVEIFKRHSDEDWDFLIQKITENIKKEAGYLT